MKGINVGNLLNEKGITWGWFQGGFDHPTTAQHKNIGGNEVTDYSPHHEPFQYFQSTANPTHAKPSSPSMIGKTDQANHQYDLNDFWTAVDNGNMPAVSYLKAPMYEDGHAGYSDPLDEQKFLVDTINKLEKTSEWKDTAVIISYDDSDGWYDHVFAPSNGKSVDSGQFGYGPRLPLLVISPYAKTNFVDHTLTDQSSILKFIEDNWNLGRIGGNSLDAKAGSLFNMFDFSHGPKAKKLYLNDKTGEPQKKIKK
jgi:phospholipase C